ncbi:MAG TPA: IclR family transcriptional regulator [Clostridiaceae bacterium]|nr:IclR family transcriptional regulator [Clostridiaceae bacterium]
MNNDRYLLSSVYNTLKILDLLSEHEELGVAEISRMLDMGKTSVFRMLYTLEKEEYVHKTSNAKYKLGLKFAHYGSIVLERQDYLSVAKPFLQKLRDKYNQTTHLGILDEDNSFNIIFMEKEMSKSFFQMTSRIGSKKPAYCTALGKTLLANILDEDLEKKIKSFTLTKITDSTITDNDKLIEVLKKIREQGYGEDLEESEVGLICYAAPVRDITKNTIAAVSISGPAETMKKNKKSMVESVKETADEISKALGYIKNGK